MTQTDVIRASALTIEAGAELLDSSGVFILDFSNDLLGGEVVYDNDTAINSSATFVVARSFNWENQRVALYITMTDDATGEAYRFELGTYLPETPKRSVGLVPAVYTVQAYGVAELLNTPYGATYEVSATTKYIATVEALLDALGLTHNIDQEEEAATLSTGLVWVLDSENTYLKIINDLLAGIGYEPIYADRDGTFVSKPWLSDSVSSPIFTYDDSVDDTTITAGGLTYVVDYWAIPNKWIFILDNPDEALPVEGAGIYTVTNQSDGTSSIDQRGRTLVKIVRLKEATTQAALVVQGDRIVEQDRRPTQSIELKTIVNPLHWHRNVVKVNSNDLGLNAVKFSESSWRLSLTGGVMSHTFKEIA